MINGNLKFRALRTLNLENEKKPSLKSLNSVNEKGKLNNNTSSSNNTCNTNNIKLVLAKPHHAAQNQKKIYKEFKLNENHYNNNSNCNSIKDVSQFNFGDPDPNLNDSVNDKSNKEKQTKEFASFQNLIKVIEL